MISGLCSWKISLAVLCLMEYRMRRQKQASRPENFQVFRGKMLTWGKGSGMEQRGWIRPSTFLNLQGLWSLLIIKWKPLIISRQKNARGCVYKYRFERLTHHGPLQEGGAQHRPGVLEVSRTPVCEPCSIGLEEGRVHIRLGWWGKAPPRRWQMSWDLKEEEVSAGEGEEATSGGTSSLQAFGSLWVFTNWGAVKLEPQE